MPNNKTLLSYFMLSIELTDCAKRRGKSSMKPNFKLHPNENISLAIVRVHKHLRSLEAAYEPQSHYSAHVHNRKAAKQVISLVKK